MKVRRHGDDEGERRLPPALSAASPFREQAIDAKIFGDLHAGDDGARDRPRIGHDDTGRHAFRVGVDGVAEEDELDDRNADDHGEGQPVAPHLDDLFQEDGANALAGAGVSHRAVLLRLRLAHQADEDILERGLARRHFHVEASGDLAHALLERRAIGADDVQVFAECRDLFDARHSLQRARCGGRAAAARRRTCRARIAR